MPFLNPTLALLAISAIAIPIAIHFLLRRKRAPIPFGAMQFLLAAYRTQRKRLQLEQLLLLLLRCAVVALLGFAVGRPIWGALQAGGPTGPRTTVFVVDTSLTSGVTDASGNTALDRSVQAAKAQLAQLDSTQGDRAALVVTTPQVAAGASLDERVIVPVTPDLRAVERALAALTPLDAQASVPAALESARGLLSQISGNASITLLSELRTGSLPGSGSGSDPFSTPLPVLSSTQAATTSLAAPQVAQAASNNIALVQVQPLRAVALLRVGAVQQPVAARVKLARFGPASASSQSVTIHLWALPLGASMQLPQTPDAVATATFEPGATTATITPTIPLRASDNVAPHALVARIVSLTPEFDAIANDNLLAAPLSVQTQLVVALISPGTGLSTGNAASLSSADWLTLAFAPTANSAAIASDSEVLVRSVLPGELVSLASQAGSLPAALADCAAVVVCEPSELSVQAWQTLARARAAGKPIIIMPPDVPPASDAQLPWAETMSQQLNLGWQLSAPEALSETSPTASSQANQSGSALLATTNLTTDADPLALLRAELPSLARNVRIFRSLSLAAPAASAPRIVLASEGDRAFLVASDSNTAGSAPVVLFLAAPTLAWTDLPARPLMVPLFQELLRQIAARSDQNQLLIAGDTPAPNPVDAIADAKLVLAGSSATTSGTVVPLATGNVQTSPLVASGIWALRTGSGSTRSYAFTQPSIAASDATLPSAPSLASWLAAPGWRIEVPTANDTRSPTPLTDDAQKTIQARATTAQSSASTKLSFILLAIALALLLIETFVARFLSHAKPTGVNRDGAVVPAMPPVATQRGALQSSSPRPTGT